MSTQASTSQAPYFQDLPWDAHMVQPACDAGAETRPSFLRKTFQYGSASDRIVLRITALGLYIAFINGKRVGDDLLTPGWTSYQARLSYQAYDVTDMLRDGENTIDIWLSDGWYRGRVAYELEYTNTWGDEMAALVELRTAAGTLLLASDDSWSSGFTPIVKSGIYFGEVYDAREDAFETPYGSKIVPFAFEKLVPGETSGVKELAALPVVGSYLDGQGRTIYDFGQNSAGYVVITVEGDRGAKVIVEHAEIRDKNGDFYNANYLTAEARLEYVLKGGAAETYKPFFTFMGFRYARVTIEGNARLQSIASVPITSVTDVTGSFTTGHPLVNQLVHNTLWSQRTNFIDIPSDCPQRAERLGWTGDIQIFAQTACYLHDSHTFLRKWVNDLMADQRPNGGIPFVSPDPFYQRDQKDYPGKIFLNYGSTGWGDAIVSVPWALYLHYGDREVLQHALPAMLKWNDFVWGISDGPIVRPPVEWNAPGFTFGDWLQPKHDDLKAVPTMGDEAAATVYLYFSSMMTAKIAAIVGDEAEARRMSERAQQVKVAFQKEFITRSGRLAYDDQSSYALAFLYDLIPDEDIDAAKEYFRNTIHRHHGRIGTGFIGTPALLPALVKIGAVDLAAQVFLQEEVPGWLAQITRGATTIWERWDGLMADGSIHESSMNSFNHYAYGAVCQWLFESVAGFRPVEDNPAFKRIVFEPVVIPALSPVSASYDTINGRVSAGWSLEGETVTYSVSVPVGSTGSLVLAHGYHLLSVDDAEPADGAVDLNEGDHTIVFTIDPTV